MDSLHIQYFKDFNNFQFFFKYYQGLTNEYMINLKFGFKFYVLLAN